MSAWVINEYWVLDPSTCSPDRWPVASTSVDLHLRRNDSRPNVGSNDNSGVWVLTFLLLTLAASWVLRNSRPPALRGAYRKYLSHYTGNRKSIQQLFHLVELETRRFLKTTLWRLADGITLPLTYGYQVQLYKTVKIPSSTSSNNVLTATLRTWCDLFLKVPVRTSSPISI